MNILVTGGAGYIGSHACKALAAKGYVPITDDNLSRGHRWAVKWGPLLEGETPTRCACAPRSSNIGRPYYRNNLAATASLLETIIAFRSIRGVLVEPRRLRQTRAPSHSGGPSAAADQPLWALQAVCGTDSGGSCARAQAALDCATLF